MTIDMKTEEKALIERLYFELYEPLVSYANSILRNRYRAEELTHEVFVCAVCRPDELLNSPNPKGWLYRTMRNMLQNNSKATARQLKLMADYLSVNGVENTAFIDLPSLKLQYGTLAETAEFNLIYDMAVLSKTHEEMARERGISINACKKRVERAKKSLRQKLSK